MREPFTPYLLCRPKGDGIEWPQFDTTQGKPAVAVFTSPDKARQFLQDKKLVGVWNVGRMEQPELVRWLRTNLTSGCPLVLVDPQAGEGTVVEILRFLAAIEDPGQRGNG
jgi:hypothetical protein